MKCWRCGQELEAGAGTCGSCGAAQERTVPTTEAGSTLRSLYDRLGPQEVLTNSQHIVNALGGASEEEKKARGLFRLALDSGAGRLILDQLHDKACWDEDYLYRFFMFLRDDAGMNDKSAYQLTCWVNDMIGWKQEEKPRQRPYYHKSFKFLCIDLGGSTARAAVFEGGQPTLVPNPDGGYGRPCAVGTRDGRLIVCEEAMQQAVTHPEQTALNFKSLIGSDRRIELGDMAFPAQFLSALVLRRLREDAACYLGEDPTSAVITVPNSYTCEQRKAVMDAGRMAGLTVERLINNTSAAAMGLGLHLSGSGMTLVCCMGSSSFDVSLMELSDGIAEACASSGDAGLGGGVFTDRIVYWILNRFQQSEGIDLGEDPMAMARVRQAAETAKKELSDRNSTQIFLPCIALKDGKPLHFDQTLSRKAFNDMTATLRDRARELIQSVINDAGVSPEGIKTVVFVGGGSRMPAMRDTLRQVLGRDILQTDDALECTVLGAAVQGGVLTGDEKDSLLLEVSPYSLGIEIEGGLCKKLIKRNTTYPVIETQSFSTAADNQTTVDVHLLEGESEKAAENKTIGKFRITDIPPAAKGVPKIEVTFRIEASGVISVSAKDTGSGKERSMTSLDRPAFSEQLIKTGTELVEQTAALWYE